MYSFHKIKAAAAMLMVGVLLATAFTATAQAGSGTRQGLTAEQRRWSGARAQAMDRYYHLGAHSPAAVARAGREAPADRRPTGTTTSEATPSSRRRARSNGPMRASGRARCSARSWWPEASRSRFGAAEPPSRRFQPPREPGSSVFARGKTLLLALLCVAAVLVGTAAARPGRSTRHGTVGSSPVRVRVRPGAIDLFRHASIIVGGLTGARLEVRLVGAIDRHGPAYEWTPYPWRRLRPLHGTGEASALRRHRYSASIRYSSGSTTASSSRRLVGYFECFRAGSSVGPHFPPPPAQFVTSSPTFEATRCWLL